MESAVGESPETGTVPPAQPLNGPSDHEIWNSISSVQNEAGLKM